MGSTGSGTGTLVTPVANSLQTIIDIARYRLNNVQQPWLWSDAELVVYANECLREFLFSTKMLNEATDADICTLTLSDGVQNYAISDRIFTVQSARISGESRDLELKSTREMTEEVPAWLGDTNEGTPTKLILDFQHGYFYFWPVPDTTYTCSLHVFRIHETDFTGTSLSGQSLEIPSMYASVIAEGVAAKALLKSGPETFDPQKSQIHWAIFNGEVGKAKLYQLRLKNKPSYNKPMKGFM